MSKCIGITIALLAFGFVGVTIALIRVTTTGGEVEVDQSTIITIGNIRQGASYKGVAWAH